MKPYTILVNRPLDVSPPVYIATMLHVKTDDLKKYVKDHNLDVACVFAGHLYNEWPDHVSNAAPDPRAPLDLSDVERARIYSANNSGRIGDWLPASPRRNSWPLDLLYRLILGDVVEYKGYYWRQKLKAARPARKQETR